MNYYNLADGRYAVRFPYHTVTERTLFGSLPKELRGKPIKFAAETLDEAGTKRMDSDLIRKAFPVEVAMLEACNENPKDFIIVQLQ